MKKIYQHYKFKSLLTLARLDCTLFLHYSFTNNLGILVALFGVFLALGIECESNDRIVFGMVVVIIGLAMGGEFTNKLMEIYTIQDDKSTTKSRKS